MAALVLMLNLSLPTVQVGGQGQSFPHLSIDWANRRVELDAVVVLREGYLELVACTPNTREHESIVVVPARPLHVWQALGLLGIESGHPPRWDAANEQVIPARGARLEIAVRYDLHGQTLEHPIDEWLWDGNGQRPCASLPWVLAGSIVDPEAGMAADVEGTLICVVDFDSALICLDVSYSADNASLWLVPRTERVPPVGTRCTMILSEAQRPAVRRIEIGPYGAIRYDGRNIALKAVAAAIRDDLGREPNLEAQVISHRWTLAVDRQAARAAVQAGGVDSTRITEFERPQLGSLTPRAPARLSAGQQAAWARFMEDTELAGSSGQLLHGFSTAVVAVLAAAEDSLSWIEQRLPSSISDLRQRPQPVGNE